MKIEKGIETIVLFQALSSYTEVLAEKHEAEKEPVRKGMLLKELKTSSRLAQRLLKN